MPTIPLTDSSSATVDASVLDTSVIGKTPASIIQFLRSDVIGAMDQTLDQVQINMVSAGFSYQPSFPLMGGTASFTAGGSLTGEIDLYKPAGAGQSSPLFPEDQFGTSIEMGNACYLALALQLGVKASETAGVGAFCLQPSATGSASAKLYEPFAPVAGRYPTLKQALGGLLGAFALPSSVDDARKMAVGAVFAFDAQGSVSFNASVDLLAMVNPTATPGVSRSAGPISISAGPSVSIGGGFSLTGELQVRIWRKSETVIELGYYKKRGSSFTVSFDASAEVDVTLGKFDVLAKVYGLLGDSGKLDAAWLKANVSDAAADEVQAAYQAAVQKKLSIAIDEECDTSITDQAAFSWNFDLGAIGADGIAAFAKAIRSNLSDLMAGTLPAGVTRAGSVFDRMKDNQHAFTFNFLGLFDHASVQESVVELSTKVTEDGQLILTDSAHLTRLSADATPFVKSDPLRRVYAEDCAATVGYAASLGPLAAGLTVKYSYYDYESQASVGVLQGFVDLAGELGEAGASGDWSEFLEASAGSQHASILAALDYDPASASRLFLDQSAQARTIEDYERAGRAATLKTPGIGRSDAFDPWLEDDAKWSRIRDAGTAQNFYSILGVDTTAPPAWATVSFAWTLHIVLWSPAMHSAGQALQAVQQYLAANAGRVMWTDPEFAKRRQTFVSQLNTAIQKAPLFQSAVGILIMDNAAPPSARRVEIRYGGTARNYN